MKKYKFFTLLSIVLVLAICMPAFSFAQELDEEGDDVPDPQTAIKENYWAELEQDPSVPGGIYPKYLMKWQESALRNCQLAKGFDSPSTGIYKDFNTLTYMMGYDAFEEISQPELQVSTDQAGDPNFQEGKYHNPFNFDLNTDFIRYRDQLNIYADLAVNGNTENKSVATHDIGEALTINFSVDLSNLSKWQNARFWFHINGDSMGDAWKTDGTEGYRATDSELVFVLNIPHGISVPDDVHFTVAGLNYLQFTSITQIENKLILKVHPKLGSEGYMTSQEYYAYLKTIGVVTVSLEGLYISDDAPVGENITITGSAVGVQDEFSTDSKEAAINKMDSGNNNVRVPYFFAAKQSTEGRDAAAPADKPNLISYTFKVKNSVHTVNFMDGENLYASVKVEQGKSIDEDGLLDESMPQDPFREGLTFKEWNTEADGSGLAFTGTSIVNEDMVVYAIYEEIPEIVIPAPNLPRSIWVSAPMVVKQIEGGQPAVADSFSFRLDGVSYAPLVNSTSDAANSATLPLPQNSPSTMMSEDRMSVVLTIQGASSGSFGQINYTEPGIYTYQITEVAQMDQPYLFDNAVYTFTDYVYEQDGELEVKRSLFKDGQEINAITAFFTNTYTGSPAGPDISQEQIQSLPATGSSSSLPLSFMLTTLGFGILVCLKKQR